MTTRNFLPLFLLVFSSPFLAPSIADAACGDLGYFVSASVTTLSSTSTTGLDITSASGSYDYSLYEGNPSLWGNLQPGGFVEYTVFAAAAGTFGVQAYYSTTEAGAGTDILVNGVPQTYVNLPTTGSWGIFQLSSASSITLPAGNSVIRVAAQSEFKAYNLEGLLFTPLPSSSSHVPPPGGPAPVTIVSTTGTTNFDITLDSNVKLYTLYSGPPALWGNMQPGGFIEYTISAGAGDYALRLYYATTVTGGADIVVGGIKQQAAGLPSTGSWGTFQMSNPVTLNVPAGTSVIRIAAQSAFAPFNLAGMTLSPVDAMSSPGRYPLSGTQFYVNPYSEAAQNVTASCSAYYPDSPGLIAKIAAEPQGVWFGSWNTDVMADASAVAKAAAVQGKTPIMVAYNIPIRDCSGYSGGGAASAEAYTMWIHDLAVGIGSAKSAMILEPDALTQLSTPGCLSQAQQSERLSLLNAAVSTFRQYAPNTSVYIDAGHDGAIAASEMAARLQGAGVGSAAGFALNTSNYITTAANTTYGQQISALIGNKHFVIDTSRNGLGPTLDNQWCNPPNRGLGARPQGFGSGNIDAFLWVQNPGTSDGSCNGGPPAGTFWVNQACTLAHNAPF